MDEREPGGGGPDESDARREQGRTSAGAANTPSFGRESAGQGGTQGRPPSHQELQQGKLGGERMEGIAMNREDSKTETRQVMEETRDKVATAAAPVVAEKMQEAISETADRLGETIDEQGKKTATAMRHDTQQMIGDKADEFREQAETRANRAIDQTADRLEGAARKLHETADRQMSGAAGGVRAKAGRWVHDVADTGESAASYLRDTDVADLRQGLQRQVREQPLQTLLIGVAAGWVLGKIIR
ncbi:hypothetical protein BH23GEM3_BH23GEM3_18500 [soil metagenome]